MLVVIVGAGLAGLSCARTLLREGVDVEVVEASDDVGGRVRTDRHEGFRLDRGFQVLFTAYPAARRQLALEALDLRAFDPGAIVCRAGRRHVLSDPLRDPGSLLESLFTRIISPEDKLRTLLFTLDVKNQSIETLFDGEDQTTEDYLRSLKFSNDFKENFIRPFFGSIFQSETLQTSAHAFRYYWRMMAEGDTVVPARGMGEIPGQIAQELYDAARIRLRSPVAELLRTADGASCRGVRLTKGDTIYADRVVVATAAPEMRRLTGVATPEGSVGTTQFYFAGATPVYAGKKILLHANKNCFVRSAVQVTNVAPEYALPGEHLLTASVPGVPEGSDTVLFDRALADLNRMFAGEPKALAALKTYRPLRIYRLPYGQFAQPPGIYANLPQNDPGIPGLLLAGECTEASSLNFALRSGEKAAELILNGS